MTTHSQEPSKKPEILPFNEKGFTEELRRYILTRTIKSDLRKGKNYEDGITLGFTDQEALCLEGTAQLFELFRELPTIFRDDQRVMCDLINQLEESLFSRPTYRAYLALTGSRPSDDPSEPQPHVS